MEIRVRELRDSSSKRLLSRLISMYHKQGCHPGLSKCRYFVGVVEENGVEYWVAGAILQDPRAFISVFSKALVDTKRSYFLRRVCRFVPKSVTGDVLVEFLNKLSEKLRAEGKECIVTLGLDDHSNKLYELAGFKRVGCTTTNKPIYVKHLREK